MNAEKHWRLGEVLYHLKAEHGHRNSTQLVVELEPDCAGANNVVILKLQLDQIPEEIVMLAE